VDLLSPRQPAEYRVTGVQTFIVSHAGIRVPEGSGPGHSQRVQQLGPIQPGQDVAPPPTTTGEVLLLHMFGLKVRSGKKEKVEMQKFTFLAYVLLALVLLFVWCRWCRRRPGRALRFRQGQGLLQI